MEKKKKKKKEKKKKKKSQVTPLDSRCQNQRSGMDGNLQIAQTVQRDFSSENVQEPDDLSEKRSQKVQSFFKGALGSRAPFKTAPSDFNPLKPLFIPRPAGSVSYVLVLHVFEQSQLSVSPLGEEFGLEGPVKLLDGHLRPRPAIPRRTGIDKQTGDLMCRKHDPKEGLNLDIRSEA